MKPYYEDDACTIYHGDAWEVVPLLTADALVTDPPYGVGLGQTSGRGRRKRGLLRDAYLTYEDTYENYLNEVVPLVRIIIDKYVQRGAVFVGPHFQDMPKADALGGVYCPSGAGRHSWGFKTFLPVLLYGTAPNLNRGAVTPTTLKSTAKADGSLHPCPKPLEWMSWLITLTSSPSCTVLDPFMGSGTTLRAAKDLGRKAVGIEIEERYCEIAARRLGQEVLAV